MARVGLLGGEIMKTVSFEPHEWFDYAVKEGYNPSVIAFFRYNIQLFERTTPKAINLLNELLKENLTKDFRQELIVEVMGEIIGIEFLHFELVINNMPAFEDILNAPKTAKIPEHPAVLYGLVEALGEKASPDNMKKICEYINRLPDEYGVIAVKIAVLRDPKLIKYCIPLLKKWEDGLMWSFEY